MKKIFCFCLVLALLAGAVSAGADNAGGSFIISEFESGDTLYYRVYSNPEETIGAPTFYKEPGDQYNNIYTGWDVSITFYQQYDGATLEQADAFCRYLTEHSEAEDRCAGYYYYEGEGYIRKIVVYLFEGWDFNKPDLDFQKLWDRNIWMNCNATGLILEYLGYGLSDELQDYAWKIGCSASVCVSQTADFPGVSFGFHFIEGTDDHVVRKYCLE